MATFFKATVSGAVCSPGKLFQGVKFLFFPIFWPASYFLLFFHEIPSSSYFFRVLLGTQKHFEIFEIKLPIKLINSTKN